MRVRDDAYIDGPLEVVPDFVNPCEHGVAIDEDCIECALALTEAAIH